MSKPNRLDALGSMVQRKGAAARPAEIPQRGEPVPSPVPLPVDPATAAEKKKRSLTLKLTEAQYQRLRAFGFKVEQSHQEVMETALMRYLDSQDA
ncbi:hypothetical protein JL101_036495 (plasmid) [Skermanella rosea]|uniref:hypothetical protein n=1 Tax=Skermanella rosea TaxID=1817965 RepID=UPI001933E3B8|nr:hypothetical protein [Skermanella rosea]UEM08200.1 hypothetical protein JL101_036495 [Skermanella rosea]